MTGSAVAVTAKADLRSYIDSNLFSLLKCIMECNGGIYRKRSGFCYVRSGTDAWGNVVFDLDLTDPLAIGCLVHEIQDGCVPNYVMTGPTTAPEGAARILIDNGFTLRSVATGMTLIADEYTYEPRLTRDLVIRSVETDDDLELWSGIVTTYLFGRGGGRNQHEFASLIRSALNQSRIFCHLGIYQSQPVAASAWYGDESVAGIYYVAVHQGYRNMGIGHEITAAAVADSFEHGYADLILQASDLGRGVYRRLGFKEVALLGRYVLPVGR